MPDALSHLQKNLNQWASDAQQGGWLNASVASALDAAVVTTPSALFDKPNRPLVVGFFGGTGVGKSTLLNRFAGETIAKASAERPTSRNITLYVHEAVSVDRLPAEFPLDRINTNTHKNNQYRSVLWIDMPDFVSVVQSNRELVDQWLPHIDVVIYVVSPDRYKDDHGWRLLLEHGLQHAWLFVINHWDKGNEQQRDDFKRVLNEAGLTNPLLFCTDSSGSSASADEFDDFRETINTLADQQLVEQLEARGVVQRLKKIREVTEQQRSSIGLTENTTAYQGAWPEHWQPSATLLQESTDWKIPALAEAYGASEPGVLNRLLNRISGKTEKNEQPLALAHNLGSLTDDVYFARIDDAIDDFAHSASTKSVSVKAIQQHLAPVKAQCRDQLPAIIEQSVQRSLATPGKPWQRLLHRTLKMLAWLLPLTALAWVAFRVVNVFRLGADNPAAYLSSNFAVHSLLLVGMAWLIPTLLAFKLKPKRAAAAASGARAGITQANDFVAEQVNSALNRAVTEQSRTLEELDEILAGEIEFDDGQLPDSLQRMLISR